MWCMLPLPTRSRSGCANALESNFKIEVSDEWWGIKELNVYGREYPVGGVTLGGNRAYGAHGKCDPQYLVIIEPL